MSTIIKATIGVKFINGRNGQFPVGTLRTDFGVFVCRDKWLETLDEGTYGGTFELDSIELSHYMTMFEAREVRTYMKAKVSSFMLDSMDDMVENHFVEVMDDPITEEVVAVPKEEVVAVPKEDCCNEAELLVRKQLRLSGNDENWTMGSPIVIPSELDRESQRAIRACLTANKYKLTSPTQRLWEVCDAE